MSYFSTKHNAFQVSTFKKEESCGMFTDINRIFKCKTFVNKKCKNCRWISRTFLPNPSLFQDLCIWASFSTSSFVCKIKHFGESNISFTNQIMETNFVFPFFCQILWFSDLVHFLSFVLFCEIFTVKDEKKIFYWLFLESLLSKYFIL